jgi:sugar transferase EpsL
MMKRAFDLTIVICGIVIWGPLLIVIATLVLLKIGPPIFFRQVRPGLGGKPFHFLKFRTMTEGLDSRGKLLPDAERITPFGRLLRSTSLDELPGLLCVLKGDMSLVGPRPLLMQYLGCYSPEQFRRHEVQPGITGWAQINGRNAIAWNEKFLLDVWYVDHRSFWLDAKILVKTFMKVVKREGISSEEHATMPLFTGTPNSTNPTDFGRRL